MGRGGGSGAAFVELEVVVEMFALAGFAIWGGGEAAGAAEALVWVFLVGVVYAGAVGAVGKWG